MSVSNYIQDKKYLIKDLDNYIYLFPFNEPILNYITDDGTLNATASNINGNGYEVYCENVSYVSNASIDNRFSFEHTLTLTILDISTSLLNHFMMNKWMVLFKNKSGDIFVLNAEYPIDVTYQYNINDENTPNSLTITLKSLSNTPIIKFGDNVIDNDIPSTSGGTESSGSTSGGTDNPNTSGGTESSGSTECTDKISFAWSGSSSSHTITINNTEYKAIHPTGSTYSVTLRELTKLDISEFTSAKYMFSGLTNITAITSIPCTNNVTNMSYMFRNCYRLTELDVTKTFNTSNVTDMRAMFDGCDGLTSLDLSSFDTSNVTDMYAMFNGCDGLTSLDLSSFNTSKVTSMRAMFDGCDGLTSLDLSNFDTSNVSDLQYTFRDCRKLTSLDLSNWDLSQYSNPNIYHMFRYCLILTTIKVTNCNDTTISILQKALKNVGYSSTVSNEIITVTH